MLSRLLLLSVIWLMISAIATFVAGTRLRRPGGALSRLWLVLVIGSGGGLAWLAFGQLAEVMLLSALALVLGAWCIRRLPDWNALGQVTWAMSLLTTVLFLIYSLAVTLFTPLHVVSFVLSMSLVAVEGLALFLSLSFTFETLDVCTRWRWRRRFEPPAPIPGYTPKVSLHVPAYNEPPEVVAQTLRALAQLDYPNYEVVLVDNNTPDEATWRPLHALCQQLGPRFKCLHLDRWPGYKSGALNFALTVTAPDAEVIAIIDADYQVAPEFLRETVPYFANPQVAFLQTPQDYRDYAGNPFLEAGYNAGRYFFEVTMALRNERNAIIFGGTMGLIRHSALQAVGGWDEWCITEDAELSLRLLKQSWQGVYLNRRYGRGLMPLDFEGLKKQRFRWCFGGIQILRKHWEALMPWARWVEPGNRLTPAQQYFYLVSGLQWYNELLTLVFTAFLLVGGLALMAGFRNGIRPLAGPVIAVPLVLLTVGLWRFGWALRHALGVSWRPALAAMGNLFSLSWTVVLGSIQGLIQPRGVFLRTPKSKSRSSVVRAIHVTQWETALGAACLLVGLGTAVWRPGFAAWIMALLLLWQGGRYLAAPAYSLLSLRTARPVGPVSRAEIHGRFVSETRTARWSLALLALLVVGFGLLRFLPEPAVAPRYVELLPTDFAPQGLVGSLGQPRATSQPTALPTVTEPPATPSVAPSITSAPASAATGTRLATPTPLSPASSLPPGQASIMPLPSSTPDFPSPEPLSPTAPEPTPVPTATSEPPTLVPTSAASATPSATVRPLPTQAPTQPATPPAGPSAAPTLSLPTQVPTNAGPPSAQPSAVPTQAGTPTSLPAPSAVPTQPPFPTFAPTQPGPPTGVPTAPRPA